VLVAGLNKKFIIFSIDKSFVLREYVKLSGFRDL